MYDAAAAAAVAGASHLSRYFANKIPLKRNPLIISSLNSTFANVMTRYLNEGLHPYPCLGNTTLIRFLQNLSAYHMHSYNSFFRFG